MDEGLLEGDRGRVRARGRVRVRVMRARVRVRAGSQGRGVVAAGRARAISSCERISPRIFCSIVRSRSEEMPAETRRAE